MRKTAIIRKCKEDDATAGKPWCLYSHEGKLLGRHVSEESARNQEEAIKANARLYRRFGFIQDYLFLFEDD